MERMSATPASRAWTDNRWPPARCGRLADGARSCSTTAAFTVGLTGPRTDDPSASRWRMQGSAQRVPPHWLLVPCDREQRRHRRARWQPMARCGLGFDLLDVVVAADGAPYASLRRWLHGGTPLQAGPGDRRPRGLGATAGRTRGGAATARRTAAVLPAAAGNRAAAATAWSVGQRPDLRQRGKVRCEAAGCARQSSSSAIGAAGSGS